MYARFELFMAFRNSAFAIALRLLLAIVLFITPLQGILAQPAPKIFDAAAQNDLAFVAGNWKIKYTDQVLGEVTGHAVVERIQPSGQILARYTVEDPRTKQRYEMIALDVRRNRNVLEMSFFGASPSGAAGGDSAVVSAPSNAVVIEVPVGAKVTASLDGTKSDATVAAPDATAAVPPVQSSLLLRFPLGDAAAGRNRLNGQWLVRRHWQKGFDGLRAGIAAKDTEWKAAFEDASDVMRGGESWERSGPQIDSVTTATMEPFGRYANVDPSFYKEREVLTPPTWLRIEGKELPVKPNEKVEVSFTDPNIIYSGSHRPDPKVAGALQIKVDINKNIKPGPKALTLNGSAGNWEFDFPGLEPKEIRYVRRIRDNEYEATNILYLGEAYYVEVEFPYAPFYNERKFITVSENPVLFTVTKDPGRPKILRSARMLLLEENAPPPTEKELTDATNPNSRKQPLIVRAWEGAVLATTAADTVKPGGDPKFGVVEVVDAIEGRYQQALDQATAIRQQYPDPENYRFSVYIVSEVILSPDILNPLAKARKRDTQISVQDHAALILIHEELQKRVEKFSVDLNRHLPVSLPQDHPSIGKYWLKQKAQLVQTLIRAVATKGDAPLFQFKVAAPGSSAATSNGAALVTNASVSREIRLGEALSQATRDAMSGTREQKEQKFQEYATWAVIDAERQLSKRTLEALAKMHDADIRKPNELLLFARLGYDSIAPLLIQELVRPSNTGAGEPFYPRWVPDRLGITAVRGIADLIAAVKSEESYSSTEKHLLVLALVFITLVIGGGVALAAAYKQAATFAVLALAEVPLTMLMTAADIALFASDFDRALKTGIDADIALGTAPVTGLDGYYSIKAEADAAMFSAALSAAGAVGVPLFLEAARLGVRPSRAALENALFYAERRGVNGLRTTDRNTFEYLRGMAEYRATHFGADALSEMEKRALRTYYPDGLPESVAKTWKIRAGDTTLPPVRVSDPSMPRVDPRAETASVPRLPPDVESSLPSVSSSSGSSGSGAYRIDLRDAAPELSSNPVLRRIYGQGEAAARSGDAAALARQRRLEYAETQWQRLTPAEKGRVEEAWKTFEKLRRSNPKVAAINEAEAMSLLIMQAKRQRAQPNLPGAAILPSRPVDADEMAAIVAEWYRAPITADELAKAANISTANAEASLKGARSVVDRFPGGGIGAPAAKVPPGPAASGTGGTSVKIDDRARAIAKRLADMGIPAADAERAAIAPASRKLDLDAATAGAAWRRDVAPRIVMEKLGIDREQLRVLLDKYHRSFFDDPPAVRGEAIDRYLNSETLALSPVTRPPTVAPKPLRPAPDPRTGLGNISDEAAKRLEKAVLRKSPSMIPRRSWPPNFKADDDIISLEEIVRDHYRRNLRTDKLPPLHVTTSDRLMEIAESKRLEHNTLGASWSHSGTLRSGNIAIRVKPGSERFVRFVEATGGYGQVPEFWRQGVGKGTHSPDIPVEHLEFYNYETDSWIGLDQFFNPPRAYWADP